jgi:hypothetical protein
MKIILIISAFLFSTLAFSQKIFLKDSTASCIAKWNKGDTKTLNILHNKESQVAGELEAGDPFIYVVHLTVLDKDSAGYLMQWQMGLPEQLKKINPHLADSLTVFNGFNIIYRTDEQGGFAELVNWREVRDAYIGMAELSIPKNKDAMSDSIMDRVKAMFNTKTMVENAFIQDIQIFHSPFGNTYSTRGIKVSTQLPNPFGNEPLPAVSTTRITELRPKQNYFKLNNTQEIDKVATSKLLKDVFTKMGLTEDKRIPMEEVNEIIKDFSLSIISEYRILLSKGWISKVKYQKIASSAQSKQTETYIIDLLN